MGKELSLRLSEESRERLGKILGTTRVIAQYGWIPFILYLGWSQTSPRPSIISLLSPFPSAA